MAGGTYEMVKRWRAKNPEKWKEQRRRYKLRHPEKKRESRIRNKESRVRSESLRRERIRYWVDEYKASHGCLVCGENTPCSLDFHHRDPNKKEFVVATRMSFSLDAIRSEIGKCDLLCANCHRKVHAGLIVLGDDVPRQKIVETSPQMYLF